MAFLSSATDSSIAGIKLDNIKNWGPSKKHFYGVFIAHPYTRTAICEILAFTRTISYGNKIFLRKRITDHLVDYFAKDDLRKSVSAELYKASYRKKNKAERHISAYYEDILKGPEFLADLKNILYLTLGANISPEENEMDTEYLNAWYDQYIRVAQLVVGQVGYEFTEATEIYYHAPKALLRACLMAEVMEPSARIEAFFELHNLYRRHAPSVITLRGELGKRALKETKIAPFKPGALAPFNERLSQLCPKSSSHFQSAFKEIQEKYLQPKKSGLEYFAGLTHLITATLVAAAATVSPKMRNMLFILAGVTFISLSGIIASFFLTKTAKSRFLERLSLESITPPPAEPALVPTRTIASTSIQRTALPATPKPEALPSDFRIPVFPVPGYTVIIQQTAYGSRRKISRMREREASNAVEVTPVRAVLHAQEPEPFGLQINAEKYVFAPSRALSATTTPILQCARAQIPTYFTVRQNAGEIPAELVNKLATDGLESTEEGEVLALKPRGSRGDDRLFAVKIETGTAGRALYMITHYEESVHNGAGKISTRVLETAHRNAPARTEIKFLDRIQIQAYLEDAAAGPAR